MQSRVSTPVALAVIVIAMAIAGFAYWRAQAKPMITNEKGIPIAPVEARAGVDAMQRLWKQGVQPPKSQPGQ